MPTLNERQRREVKLLLAEHWKVRDMPLDPKDHLTFRDMIDDRDAWMRRAIELARQLSNCRAWLVGSVVVNVLLVAVMVWA